MNKKIILLFSFFIILCFGFEKSIYAKQITLGSRDEWLQNVKEWTDLMVKDGDWFYSNNENRTYYKDAMNADIHTSNCALMVVHALQRFGAFGKNNKIWAGYHQIVYRPMNSDVTKKRLNAVANIYTFNNKSPDDIDLQIGDILYYEGHMNIYKGVKNGVREYYDAGSGTTVTHQPNGLWKSFIRKGNVNGVYGIIRLKYGQTVDVEGDVTDSTTTSNGRTDDPYKDGFIEKVDSSDDFNCKTILINGNGEPTEFKKLLDGIFNIIQVLAPIIAIALTIIDYIKALSNGDTKKANIRTIKRIAIAVLVVFLPMLLDLLFHLFGLYDISTCEIGR